MIKRITAAALALSVILSGSGALSAELPSNGGIASGGGGGYMPKAFPTAEGGGMYTTGARGAEKMEVYHVTNLNDSGEGSFRDAVSEGNRIIVFDVSGMIDLMSKVSISRDNITILGQTAPGDGICFRSNSVKINGKNIILRYLRFRCGSKMPDGTNTADQDGFGIPVGAENVIMDHCSVSWGTDENLSVIGAKNVTVQWSIVSEALNQSIHVKGEHGYAGIWGGVDVSFHHNIIATHKSRNPKIGTSETVSMTPGYTDKETVVDIWNNVFYNWGDKCGYGAENGANVNIVNNYYKPGPATPDNKRARIFELSPGNKYQPKWSGDIYADGNYIDDNIDPGLAAEVSAENWQIEKKTGVYVDSDNVDTYTKLEEIPSDSYLYDNKNIETAQEAYDRVIADAGAQLPKLDAVDARVIDNVKNRTAPEKGVNGSSYLVDEPIDGIPEGEEENYDFRGYPIWDEQTRPSGFDTDGDGIPDEWEDKMGLNSSNPHDSLNIGPDGYTWLEIYGEDLIYDYTAEEDVKVTLDGDNPDAVSVQSADAVRAEFYSGNLRIASASLQQFSNVPEGSTVIAAGYSDGVLSDFSSASYTEGMNAPEVSGETKKIFIWDSLSGMKPVDGASFGFNEKTWLDEGMNIISAKLYYADGTSRITPVTVTTAAVTEKADETVTGDFDIVAELEDVPNLVNNAYKGIFADNFAILCGYDDSYNRVIRYGKLGEDIPSYTADKDYKYIKLSVRNSHVDLYAAKTLASWDKLSEDGYDYTKETALAGSYKITPKDVEYDALVPWRVITEQTNPTVTITNVENNDRIGLSQTLSVHAIADGESKITEMAVLFNNKIIKTVSGLSIGSYGDDIEIPVEFSTAAEGTLKVMCFDENLCSGETSAYVYVSGSLEPWSMADVGTDENDVKMYSIVTDDFTYKLNTTEGNISGTSDKFGYMYQEFSENMRLYSRIRVQSSRQCGYVLRNDLEPDGVAYFIGCDRSNGECEYGVWARSEKGGEMTKLCDLTKAYGSSFGDKIFLIAEKSGSSINVYRTEYGTELDGSTQTVYRSKRLLYTIENSALNDTYLMGFGAAADENTSSPADAGWIALDGGRENEHDWNLNYGLDWCWQSQERNILKPEWTEETIGGNATGKMLITTAGDSYDSERYIFREYTIDDGLIPELTTDILISGDNAGMNVYLQYDNNKTAYKVSFKDDHTICDASGNILGEWESSTFYTVKLRMGVDPTALEMVCKLTVTAADGSNAVSDAVIPLADVFRTQINTQTKAPVSNAVYFEPIVGADGTYYIDNVKVLCFEDEYKIVKSDKLYTFGTEEGYEGLILSSGVDLNATKSKTIEGTKFTGAIRVKSSSSVVAVPVDGACTVTVYASSASSSEERKLVINDGAEHEMTFGTASSQAYEYTGGAGTINIYARSGIDVYGIRVFSSRIESAGN